MDKFLLKTRIVNAITIGGDKSRAELQDYLNADQWGLNPDVKKTTMQACINILIDDKKLEPFGEGNKRRYRLYQEPELKLSKLWKTPKFKRPNLKKILNDLRKKVCVMEGSVK